MTAFATPTPLNRRIGLALAHLRAARYDSNPHDIHVATQQMNELLERIAARPLAIIDPVLDARLTIARK